jgi:hypothetical protein
MPERENQQLPPGAVQYVAEPVIIGHDVNTPDVEPLFANHFEIMVSNTDVFVDIGIIDPRAMAAMMKAAQEKPGQPATVKFSVLQRLAMSPASFVLLAAKVRETMDQLMEAQVNAGKGQDISKQSP